VSEQNAHTPTPPEPLSAERVVADAIERHMVKLGTELNADSLPSEKQLEEMLVLSRLRDSLKPPKKNTGLRRRLFSICFVAVLTAVLLWSGFYRVGSSAAEFNVKAASIQMDFEGGGKGLLIPGEDEEALSITHATVSGIERSDLLPDAGVGNSLQLYQDVGKNAPPIRLQQFAPPDKGPFTLMLGTSYQPKGRGLVLLAPSEKNTSPQDSSVALMGPVPQETKHGTPNAMGYDAFTLYGKKLEVEFYPVPSSSGITVLRNVTINAIRFETDEVTRGTSVLGGSLFERDLGDRALDIQSGDILQIVGKPLHVRQLIFKDGVYQLSLSSPKSSKIQLGEDTPKDLMPTLLQRWIAIWPTQLYTTLSAIVLFWFGIQKWWKGED
jgi:hypothetical protein